MNSLPPTSRANSLSKSTKFSRILKQSMITAGMAQWWEHLPSTNVAGFDSRSRCHVGWVCCWLLSLLRGFFSGYSGFPPSIKTNLWKFQFDLDVKCLHMNPWLGRLGDYSPHYDVKFDSPFNLPLPFFPSLNGPSSASLPTLNMRFNKNSEYLAQL